MSRKEMIDEALRLGLGELSNNGTLMVKTGVHTGRAAKNRYFVRRLEIEEDVAWGPTNLSIDPKTASSIAEGLTAKLSDTKTYSYKGYVGGLGVEVKSSSPWHIAFANNMFRETPCESLARVLSDVKPIEIFHMPEAKATEFVSDFSSETAIIIDLVDMRVFIMGTAYAGEIKKSAFTICNFILPQKGALPMHASANCLPDGSNSSVLFGLSGTGKTTLSADKNRALIGDDEIAWSSEGLSNLEGGCYAKLINLSAEDEPEIYRAVNQSGAIAENVVYDKDTKEIDFFDNSITENTRGSYDISALSNIFDVGCEAQQPKTIVFLTADAFGALPAIAKLSGDQAQYHFVSGYTAKVAGTEMGVTEPQAAFSACFGAPFMPRSPMTYARLLADFAKKSGATVWLLNTGWTQGGYGKGPRFPIRVSRRLLHAVQNGELDNVPTKKHPVFGFEVPVSCPDVDPKYLEMPQGQAVEELAQKFADNIKKYINDDTKETLIKGGPVPQEFVPQATARASEVGMSPNP